jgi:uncharacterized protein
MIQIKILGEHKLSGYTMIEGFPGAGLVGPMTNSYMVEKLKMDYIGYIESNSFPPISVIHENQPMFPVRIYKSDKYKLVIVISEFTIPSEVIYDLSEELIGFVKKSEISSIISIGGMPSTKDVNEAYAVSSDNDFTKKITSAGINRINEGVVAGVSGILLSKCPEYKIPIMGILIPINPTIMDPKYAEVAIINLKKLMEIDINVDELEEESKKLQAKVKEMLKKTRDSHEGYKNAIDATGPSMYA